MYIWYALENVSIDLHPNIQVEIRVPLILGAILFHL